MAVIAPAQIDPSQYGDAGANMPLRPDFNSLFDPTTGNLASQYQITPQTNTNQNTLMPGFQGAWAGLKPNTSGLDLYRQQATSMGPSAWANLATQQQQQGQQQQANNAVQQNSAGTAGAASNLAMTGGLNSGARERLAIAGTNAGNTAQQNIAAQGAAARTGISMQDAQNKQNMLANLPGMENTALQPGLQKANAWDSLATQQSAQNQQNQQFNTANNMNAQNANVSNTISQNNALNQNNLGAYNNQMSAWAGNQQANATANAGKK